LELVFLTPLWSSAWAIRPTWPLPPAVSHGRTVEVTDWSLLVPWLSPFVLADLERTWAYKYPDRSAEFQQLVTSRRAHPYRDHAYATGEIDAL
jgi:hypothetical protein